MWSHFETINSAGMRLVSKIWHLLFVHLGGALLFGLTGEATSQLRVSWGASEQILTVRLSVVVQRRQDAPKKGAKAQPEPPKKKPLVRISLHDLRQVVLS